MKRAGDRKLSKGVSTKLTAEDYDLCQTIAREFYIKRNIKTPSVSELTRFALAKVIDKYRPRTEIIPPEPPQLTGTDSNRRIPSR